MRSYGTNKADEKTSKTIIHFNHAGASPSPQSVLDTVMEHMKLEQTMGGYTAAEMASDKLHSVYVQVAKLLHLDSKGNATQEIALVESATVAWTRLFYSMAHYQHERQLKLGGRKRAVILISEAEYAANVVAACQWAQNHHSPQWTVLSIPSTKTKNAQGDVGSSGIVDLEALQEMLQGNFKYQNDAESGEETLLDPEDIAMVCITHVPTNSGIVNPVADIGKTIGAFNQKHQSKNDDDMPSILYLVDACQSVGQMDVHAEQLYCHGLVATGRKFLRGPRGTGFLYTPKGIADQLVPHHIDHFGVPITGVPSSSAKANIPVEKLIQVRPKEGAARFEYYESSVANKLGLGEAIRYAREEVGMAHIQSTCQSLAEKLYKRLKSIESLKAYHSPSCGIVTFYVPETSSETIKQKLWESAPPQFETSLVPATSTPLDSSKTHAPNMVRVSLSYTNTVEDIDALCSKLEAILKG